VAAIDSDYYRSGEEMKTLKWISIPIVLVLASCVVPLEKGYTSPRVDRIQIIVQPRDGYAHCVFQQDGTIEGGHTSGGPQPFVHQDKGTLSTEKVNSIWAAVQDLNPEIFSKRVLPDRNWKGSVTLLLFERDRVVAQLAWPFGKEHADDKVQVLTKLLYQNKIGGW